MKNHQAIAFVGPLSIPHRERMFRGIVDFAQSHGNWRFLFDPELQSISLASLEHCREDGAFIFWSTPKDRYLSTMCWLNASSRSIRSRSLGSSSAMSISRF